MSAAPANLAPARVATGITTVALSMVVALWVSLFLWRKTFSYITVGGVYIIEFAVVVAFAVLALNVLVQPDLSCRIPGEGAVRRVHILTATFVAYCVARAIIGGRITAIAMIPAIYPAYLVAVTILATNVSTRVLRIAAAVFVAAFFLAPTVSYINGFLVQFVFGSIESPGWTYIYGVTLALSLVLVRRPLVSMMLFAVYLLFALFLFQRGTFVAFAFAWMTAWVCMRWSERRAMLTAAITRGFAVASVALLMAPFAIEFLTGSRQGRFVVSPGNILKFLLSIVSSDVTLDGGVSGTRSHRLEMWKDIIHLVFSAVDTAAFGFGFAGDVGDVLGISFRAPHNGFITILYRGGVVGLALFLGILFALFSFLRQALRAAKARSEVQRHAVVGLVILGAMVGESLAGTMLDSPFTSMLFYTQMGVLLAIINRLAVRR